MNTNPSQLNPLYPFETVGLCGTLAPAAQPWCTWRPQVQPFPGVIIRTAILSPTDELAVYVQQMAGTPSDLDSELECASLEVFGDDRPDET